MQYKVVKFLFFHMFFASVPQFCLQLIYNNLIQAGNILKILGKKKMCAFPDRVKNKRRQSPIAALLYNLPIDSY